MRQVVVLAVGAVLAGTALTGCNISIGSSTPTVKAVDLQNDIKDQLTDAGEPPQSVSCKEDLQGVVDTTTRCEVVLSETNAFEPIVKVTKVEGTTVSYEMTPALSQAQLEKSVGTLVEQNSGTPVETVSCEGGLEGRVGTTANCRVQGGGDSMDAVVKVTKVSGLLMNFEINEA